MTRQAYDIAPPASRIGISRVEAAALIGVSVPVFEDLVRRDLMPKARAIGTRRVWYRPEVEKSFQDLPFADAVADQAAGGGDQWD